MKAPDKIYLAESDNIKGEIISNFASSTLFKRHNSIAYIRKDMFIKLLKEKRKSITECSATEDRKVAAFSVIDFLTDKIKSL